MMQQATNFGGAADACIAQLLRGRQMWTKSAAVECEQPMQTERPLKNAPIEMLTRHD
jgi:hypothetical protein